LRSLAVAATALTAALPCGSAGLFLSGYASTVSRAGEADDPVLAGALGRRDLVGCAFEFFGRAAVAAALLEITAAAASTLDDPLVIEALGLIAALLPFSFQPFVKLALPRLPALVDDNADRSACYAAIVRLGQFIGTMLLATAGLPLLEIAAAHAGTDCACQAVAFAAEGIHAVGVPLADFVFAFLTRLGGCNEDGVAEGFDGRRGDRLRLRKGAAARSSPRIALRGRMRNNAFPLSGGSD
jgi:hypothetical protein